ncbi:hypothetical protein D0A22_17980 [Stutzerimonas stutzeri]|nr:hypothetical protein D0A22_17980 [Stutzerimonas stutzeri]
MHGEMSVTLNRLIERHIVKASRDLVPLVRETPANTLCISIKMLMQHGQNQQTIIGRMRGRLCDLLKRHQIACFGV